MPLHIFISAIWENSCSKNFVNFQEKHPRENCRLHDTGCSPGKFIKFSEQLSQKTPANGSKL